MTEKELAVRSPGPRRAPSRRWRIAGGVVAAVAVLAAAVVAAAGLVGGGAAAEPASPAVGTAEVVRTTLRATKQVAGTLGYGDVATVTARGPGGTITWLPAPGAVIGPGQPVYRVDEAAVVLLVGDVPLYRRLTSGMTGADVSMLERNLADLGYPGFTVDDEYTGATADAVRRWQRDLGWSETGRVEVHQVVVAPGPVRVAATSAELGAAAGGPVLSYTGTTKVITVDLDVADRHLVTEGLPAEVTLPDGSRVAGTVAGIGTVAVGSSAGSGPGASSPTTVDVTVAVADQGALDRYDGAPVQVTLTTGVRENVLAVPVVALVALREGGYGVQLVEGAGLRYVAVTTGLFAGGLVEISGPEVVEGAVVVVPA